MRTNKELATYPQALPVKPGDCLWKKKKKVNKKMKNPSNQYSGYLGVIWKYKY